jgi:hypothetical protein
LHANSSSFSSSNHPITKPREPGCIVAACSTEPTTTTQTLRYRGLEICRRSSSSGHRSPVLPNCTDRALWARSAFFERASSIPLNLHDRWTLYEWLAQHDERKRRGVLASALSFSLARCGPRSNCAACRKQQAAAAFWSFQTVCALAEGFESGIKGNDPDLWRAMIAFA